MEKVALFISRKEAVNYDPKKHLIRVWNFLYWEADDSRGSLLLVGNGQYEKGDDMSHIALRDCASEILGDKIPLSKPDGAGLCGGGKINTWESHGFKLVTPRRLKAEISDALGTV